MFAEHGERTQCFADASQLLVRLTCPRRVVLDYANGWIERLIKRKVPRQHSVAFPRLPPPLACAHTSHGTRRGRFRQCSVEATPAVAPAAPEASG